MRNNTSGRRRRGIVMRKWNFCAGPAVISEEVLSEVQSEILEYNNLGTSIMEMSHRSEAFTKVAFEAKEDLKKISYYNIIKTCPNIGVKLVTIHLN